MWQVQNAKWRLGSDPVFWIRSVAAGAGRFQPCATSNVQVRALNRRQCGLMDIITSALAGSMLAKIEFMTTDDEKS
jgi:hypothetical protein